MSETNSPPQDQREQGGPEQHEQEPRIRPRIYVASLSDYNAGRLHGAWLDAAQEPDALWAGINEMLARSPEPGAEEWAIHDYEAFCGVRLGEYESIESVSKIALGIAEHGPAFGAWADYLGRSSWEDLDRFEDCYQGRWDSVSDYAEDFLDALGLPADHRAGSPRGAAALRHHRRRRLRSGHGGQRRDVRRRRRPSGRSVHLRALTRPGSHSLVSCGFPRRSNRDCRPQQHQGGIAVQLQFFSYRRPLMRHGAKGRRTA